MQVGTEYYEDAELSRPVSVGIVASGYNRFITDCLLNGAQEELKRHSAKLQELIWVSGAFEIPAVLEAMARTDRYNALVALGCIVRGETSHFEYIASQCAAGCMKVSTDKPIPVGFGVLTVDTIEQALARSQSDGDNKGTEAAAAVIRSAHAISYVRMLI